MDHPAGIRLPVDVRVLNQAPLGFRWHVFRGQLLFSRQEPLRIQMLEETLAIWTCGRCSGGL